MEPVEVMHAIARKTGDIGASFYFAPETRARAKELGIDGFRFYFLGRGGVLGNVDAAVVRSAFGYFHPRLLAHMWDTATEHLAPRDAAREFITCGHEHGRRMFSAIGGLDVAEDTAAAEEVEAEPVEVVLLPDRQRVRVEVVEAAEGADRLGAGNEVAGGHDGDHKRTGAVARTRSRPGPGDRSPLA